MSRCLATKSILWAQTMVGQGIGTCYIDFLVSHLISQRISTKNIIVVKISVWRINRESFFQFCLCFCSLLLFFSQLLLSLSFKDFRHWYFLKFTFRFFFLILIQHKKKHESMVVSWLFSVNVMVSPAIATSLAFLGLILWQPLENWFKRT